MGDDGGWVDARLNSARAYVLVSLLDGEPSAGAKVFLVHMLLRRLLLSD